MAKAKKDAVAKSPTAQPRADMNGWVLCPGDGVLIVSPGEEYHGLFAKVDTFPTMLELSSYVQIDGRPSTVGRVLVPNAQLRWMGPGLKQVDQLRPTRPGQRVRVVLDNESLATPEMKSLDGQLGEVTELGPLSGNNVSMITVKFDAPGLLPAAIYNYDLLIVPTPVVEYVPEPEAELALSTPAWDLLEKAVKDGELLAHAKDFTQGAELNELQAAGLVELLPFANGSTYKLTAAGLAAAQHEPEVPSTPLADALDAQKAGLRVVPLASIVVTTNTRKVFDEAALAELAESVKAHGILQPIVLRPHPTEEHRYELVAGGRRYRAAQLAGLTEVPATVRQLTDREFLEVQLLENLQRVDVRPADEATAFAKLLQSDFSAEEVALKVGKPVKFVLQRAKLVALLPFWFELLESEKLALVAAHELARLPAHSQLAVKHEAEKYAGRYERGYSKSDIRDIINEKVLRKLDKAPWDKADATLVPSAGPCTLCPKRSAAQGVLFEMKEGVDLCLDAGCFASKRAAFVTRRLAELTVELGKAPLQASTKYTLDGNQKEAGIIASRDWYQSREGVSDAVAVLMVDGADAGQLNYVRLTGVAAMKEGRATATDAEKAETAARLRRDREAKMHRTLIGEKLTMDVQANPLGEEALAVLRWLISEQLRGQSKSKLAFVVDECGWDVPTEAQMDSWKVKEANGKTPYANWLTEQLAAEEGVLDTLGIYLALEARHKMDNEYESRQFSIAELIGGPYEPLKQQVAEFVDARYYSKKGKKQEVAA